jgi:hypothetical protein
VLERKPPVISTHERTEIPAMPKTILKIAERPNEEVDLDWCMDSSESDVSLFMIQKRNGKKG